jgi:anti-sigma B factor antagonist
MTAAPSGCLDPFRCEVQVSAQGVVSVEPAGELDVATVGEVARAVRKARELAPAALVLDLRALTFMDARGLHLLLATDVWAHQAGVPLTVVPAPGIVRRLLDLAMVDRRLQLADRPPDNGAGALSRVEPRGLGR